jgi:hypothetical protein
MKEFALVLLALSTPALLCGAATPRDNGEKIKLSLTLKRGNFQSESLHELEFGAKGALLSNIESNGENFEVEVTPRKLSRDELRENSSFLVELNIKKLNQGKTVSVAKPLLSVEMGGQAETGSNSDDFQVSVVSLR